MEVKFSEQLDQIAVALNKAQAELGSVAKSEEGYGYNYASLGATIETARAVLAKNGLSVTQLLGNDGDKPSVTTMLLHTSGQYLSSKTSLPLVEMKGCNEAQRAGAVFSYARRYALQAILNMASEDNDASSNGVEKSSKASVSQNSTNNNAQVASSSAPIERKWKSPAKTTVQTKESSHEI